MSDDSFVKEVNDELRTDQYKSLWNKYGIVLAGAALAIVLGTAGFEAYKYWKTSQASQSGDLFLAALTQAKDQKQDEALKSLAELEKTGTGAYPVLARMRSATLLAAKGDAKAAIAAYDAIAADASIDVAVRDMARLRAALLLVDNGSYEDVAKYAEVLTGDTNAMRHSAREALGLAAWKAGKFTESQGFFQSIVDEQNVPRNLTQRANVMLDLIAASGKVPAKTGG